MYMCVKCVEQALVIETYDYAKARTQEEARRAKELKNKKNNEWDGAAAMGSVIKLYTPMSMFNFFFFFFFEL
jgi:hypothetical protein